MEGSHNKESKATSDEVESPEQAVNDDTAGTGRSYECVFCKRGFTTAQALGGHMNIHRNDRARLVKSSPAASSSKRPDDAGSEINYGYYHPYPTHQRSSSVNPPVTEFPKNYAVYFPESMYGRGSSDDEPRRPRELSLFGEGLHLGLGLHGGDGKRVGEEEKREEDFEEGKLDLELRLGRDQR